MKTNLFIYLFLLSAVSIKALPDVILAAQFNSQCFRARQLGCATRSKTAALQAETAVTAHPNNGDLQRYDDFRGTFAKGLLHIDDGTPDEAAFDSLTTALFSGDPNEFNAIMMGTSGPRRLVNPQAAFTHTLAGAHPWIHSMPVAPAFASAQTAAEMVELYWTVLLRDVPFNEYDTNPLAQQAIAELNTLQDYKGAKIDGQVTAQSLLRGNTPGCCLGPYISQFLYQPIPMGPGPGGINYVEQHYRVPIQANVINQNSFLTNFDDWFFVQNGGTQFETMFDPDPTFFRTARDIGEFVHVDYPAQVYFNAASILMNCGPLALDANNPYRTNLTQEGFTTYGLPDLQAMLAFVARLALKTAWFNKWKVHLRSRPEYFGFAVDRQMNGIKDFDIHPQLINSTVLPIVFNEFGTYFLPQMFPEGSPTHPSYPAGHAVVAGACITVLKAFFNENFMIPSPVQPNTDNTELVAFTDMPLRVGDELEKLGFNILLGRDHAGVHFLSDGWEGFKLGERVAMAMLQDEEFIKNENFNGYSVTLINGQKVKIGERQVAL